MWSSDAIIHHIQSRLREKREGIEEKHRTDPTLSLSRAASTSTTMTSSTACHSCTGPFSLVRQRYQCIICSDSYCYTCLCAPTPYASTIADFINNPTVTSASTFTNNSHHSNSGVKENDENAIVPTRHYCYQVCSPR